MNTESFIIADIITIGDEILIGQITDTNSGWISSELNKIGVRVRRKYSVADNKNEIMDVLKESSEACNVVIFTGGLGPTKDDITKQTFTEYYHSNLIFNNDVYKNLESFFKIRGREVNEANRSQAFVPECCTVLMNYSGTAPGMLFRNNEKYVFSLPGVPYEMKELMTQQVLPMLKNQFNLRPVVHKTILTQGVPESTLMEMIADWENSLPFDVKLAYLPSPGSVKLRLSNYSGASDAESIIQQETQKLRNIIPKIIFGEDNDTMESVIVKLLTERNQKISFAESCTGGYLAHKLTEVSGSSAVFNGSLVTYGYESKTEILGVSKDDLQEFGAVSEQVVLQMAKSVKELFKTDYAIAVSGIAGPLGGTPEKPVGTVWIAHAFPGGISARKFLFTNDRNRNIHMTFLASFEKLRRIILDIK